MMLTLFGILTRIPANDANRIHLKKPSGDLVKILIIRFSSIGDIVLTTPVVRAVAEQMHGGAEIHYLTKEKFAAIPRSNPHIAKVYTINKSTNEIMGNLKAEGYDFILDLHNNLRSSRVKSALKMLSFTFKKYNWEKWLLVNFGIDRMPDLHIVDRYMATVKSFGFTDDGEGLDYFIPEESRVSEDQIPLSRRSGFIALAIGIPLGIWAARDDRVSATVRPVLDFMQTMPAFVYLIPAVVLFRVGVVPGIVATITAFSYLELVTKYPQAAGAALYVNKAFNNTFLTFLVTVCMLSASFAAAGSRAQSGDQTRGHFVRAG